VSPHQVNCIAMLRCERPDSASTSNPGRANLTGAAAAADDPLK
jgi:hypothetical protein